MPLSSEYHYPWRKGTDGVEPKPFNNVVYLPGPVQSAPSKGTGSGGDTSANASQYSNMTLFYAECAAADNVGNLVYAFDGPANVRTADSDQPYPVVGMIINKSDPTHCLVQRYGPVMNIVFGLTANVRYFLHHTGGLFAPPFDGSDVQFVQQVGFALGPDSFFIQPTGTVIRRDPTNGGETVSTSTLRYGPGEPTSSVGQDGDFYINVDEDLLHGPKANGVWPTPGVKLVGPPGPIGPKGEPGRSLIGGEGEPDANVGNDGDFFLATDTAQLFGPKKDGTWPSSGINLVGPAGTPGSVIYPGDGPPDDADGYPVGSYYLDRTSGRLYGPKEA